MTRKYLNESGIIGPAIVFLLAIMVLCLAWLLMTPVYDEINDVQQDMIDSGMPVSEDRIESMNTQYQIYELLLFFGLIVIGLWYWITANRARSGSL